MKKLNLLLYTFCFLMAYSNCFAQTNQIGSTGNVGIGTTAPGYLLDIRAQGDNHDLFRLSLPGTSAPNAGFMIGFGSKDASPNLMVDFKVEYSSVDYNVFSIDRSNRNIYMNGEGDFYMNGGGNFYINGGGDFGIGTETPESRLHIIQKAEDINSGIKIVGNLSPISGRIWMASEKLHIDNATAGSGSGLTFLKNGNTGLGTDAPLAKLDIQGSGQSEVNINSTDGSPDILLSSQNNAKTQLLYDVDNNGLLLRVSDTHTGITGWTGTDRLFINGTNGNVGIGTLDTETKLTVDGAITSEEVKVKDVQGADFVFSQDYELPTLQEVQGHIEKYHHLPEIPSAAEMQQNGILLGEMNMKLLQKIEELTLYLIEQNKTIQAQQENLDLLQKKINHLEKNQ